MTKENNNINYSKEGQAEFFSEFQASGRNKLAYFKKEIALGKKMVLSISYENLALFLIILIMVVVVFFSLGVERGKRIAIKNMRTWAMPHADKAAKKALPTEDNAIAWQTINKPYTIQIMAVKKIAEAEQETARLNSGGYKAFIVQSGSWYHVCVGRYVSTAELANDLAAIKVKYPDCYVRKMSNENR